MALGAELGQAAAQVSAAFPERLRTQRQGIRLFRDAMASMARRTSSQPAVDRLGSDSGTERSGGITTAQGNDASTTIARAPARRSVAATRGNDRSSRGTLAAGQPTRGDAVGTDAWRPVEAVVRERFAGAAEFAGQTESRADARGESPREVAQRASAAIGKTACSSSSRDGGDAPGPNERARRRCDSSNRQH